MKTAINPVIEPILREFKAALQEIYSNRLCDVVLSGSYARGDYDDESDIDLMVILNDEHIDTYAENRKLTEVETELLLKYGLAVCYCRYAVKNIVYRILAEYSGSSIVTR